MLTDFYGKNMKPYDLAEIPFSLAGSFLTISSRETSSSSRLAYRTSSGRAVTRKGMPFSAHDFFEIALVRNGEEIPYQWMASPHWLDLSSSDGSAATFVFADPNTLLFETCGVDLRLIPAKPFATWWQPTHDQIELIDHPGRGYHLLRAASNTKLAFYRSKSVYNLESHYHGFPVTVEFTGQGGVHGAVRFSHFESLWGEPLPEIEDVLVKRENEYREWQVKMPQVSEEYIKTAEQAWFLLWNCQVPPGGALTRPALYMSKFWMNNIWAWDNCFNALAIASADPHLAWQQLLLFFDHQDPNGMVPDMINDLEFIYGFTKPPIHGWAIQKLVEKTGLEGSLPYLEQIYAPLGKLVEWWYGLRDFDGDGMPQYHHGNDSGWDNSTIFDQGYPTEGADLAAHLVIQCETLARIARLLGKPEEAAQWQARAQNQFETLLRLGVCNERFYSPLDGKEAAPASLSLLNYIPIVLGKRLPESILAALAQDLGLTGPYLTGWGYASEAPASPKYNPNGYWRGPIWAPSTYLIIDGLASAGYLDLARVAARRFCNLCVHEPGFWENYDALTGKGLCCPGYSWTASAFLLLASWLNSDENEEKNQ
jgi:hypothetical protein